MPTDNPLMLDHDAFANDLLVKAAKLAHEHVEPNASACERERRLDRAAISEAARLGLTGMQVPSGLGGQGVSFRCKAAVTSVLAGADFGFAMALVNTHNVAAKLALEGAPEVRDRYLNDLLSARRLGSTALTEPQAGSDFPAITTRARKQTNGDWVLNGTKAWITNAQASDVIVLYAKTGDSDDAGSIASFVIDGQRQGFRRDPAESLFGQHTIGTGGFTLDGYIAHGDELLSEPGEAFKAALHSINGARIYIAAMCCGMVERALEVVGTYGRNRSSFGSALGSHQGWRWRLAEADAELAAVVSLVDRAARALDRGEAVMTIAAQAKVAATRMAETHLSVLQHAMGAAGLRDHYPLGRHVVGAQVAGFVDGSTEMLLERISAKYRR